MAIDYYNAGHFISLLYAPILFVALFFWLRKKSDNYKKWALFGVSIGAVVLFFVYKLVMGLTYGDEFILLNEIPLQPCNINLLLLPFAFLFKNKTIRAYVYFMGTIGAIFGMLFFDGMFALKPTFSFVVMMFFVYHALMLVLSLLLVCLKMYRPTKMDVVRCIIFVSALTGVMHIFNIIMRSSGANTLSNFFFTYGIEGNFAFDFLKKIIPVNLFFLIPAGALLFGVWMLMYLPFKDKKPARVIIETENGKTICDLPINDTMEKNNGENTELNS